MVLMTVHKREIKKDELEKLAKKVKEAYNIVYDNLDGLKASLWNKERLAIELTLSYLMVDEVNILLDRLEKVETLLGDTDENSMVS